MRSLQGARQCRQKAAMVSGTANISPTEKPLSIPFISATKGRQTKIMHMNTSVSCAQRLSLKAMENYMINMKHQGKI